MSDPVAVIQATLSPIFLVSGTSIFLNWLQTRLFRINDRLRAAVLAIPNDPTERAHAEALVRRQRIVRNAIVLAVVAVLLTMLTTIFLIVPAVASATVPGQVTVTIFASGLIAFAAALLLALQDTFLSVRMAGAEMPK